MNEDEEIFAIEQPEEFESNIDCAYCDYKGKMSGWVKPEDKRNIIFVCPICKSAERVKNVFYSG